MKQKCAVVEETKIFDFNFRMIAGSLRPWHKVWTTRTFVWLIPTGVQYWALVSDAGGNTILIWLWQRNPRHEPGHSSSLLTAEAKSHRRQVMLDEAHTGDDDRTYVCHTKFSVCCVRRHTSDSGARTACYTRIPHGQHYVGSFGSV